MVTTAAVVTCALGYLKPAVSQGGGTIALFEQQCASCHREQPSVGRAPTRASIRQRTPETILNALTTGSMATIAAGLSPEQKRAIAEYLAGRVLGSADLGDAVDMPNRCEGTRFADPMRGPRWNGWGADLGNSRYQPDPGIGAGDIPALKLKWAFGFRGGTSAYGQPTIAGGRVYVGADTGFVYSLDVETGCVHWSFRAQAGVRTAITIAKVGKDRPRHAIFFGDVKANVYSIDAESGKQIWLQHADPHPLARITGAPALAGNLLYVPVSSLEELAGGNPKYECCTFRGSIVAYNATSGTVVWKTHTIATAPKPKSKTSQGTQLWAPAGAAVWSAPTVDRRRGLLYVATGDAYTAPAAETSDAVLALALGTGRIVWSKQFTANDTFVWPCENGNFSETCPPNPGPDFDFGSSPMLRRLSNGRDIIVIGQKSGAAWAIDPGRRGAVLWQHRVGKGSWDGSLVWGSAADDNFAYFPNGDEYFGPAEAGGLAALKLTTGEQVWFTRPPPMICGSAGRPCVQAQTAAVTVIPGVVFSGTITGVIRAYQTANGNILWEYDTVRNFKTVNGVDGRGGSLVGPGPTVAGRMVFLTSGYSTIASTIPGNVLLAFGVD